MRKILLVGTILLGACGPSMQSDSGEPVALLVAPSTIQPGGSVELVLRNESDSEVGYNLCSSALERRSQGGWEAVPSERICTMELRSLTVGEEASYTLELPADLQPGEYRALANVEIIEAGETVPLRTPSFQVTP